MECLGLHNKPKAEVHPEHKLTGPKEEEEGDVMYRIRGDRIGSVSVVRLPIHF
jgi:hypothetical protein